MSARGVLALCAPLALAAACATTGDLERVEARVSQLEQQRAALLERMQEDLQRIERLREKLDEAEETLRKHGANLGVRVERLEQEQPKIHGRVESLEFRFKRFEHDVAIIKRELVDRLGSTSLYLPPDVPSDEDGMWEAAQRHGSQGRLPEARAIYELYESSFPDDIRAPHALWEIAKLYEGEGDIDQAIRFYQRVHERHEDSEIAPEAVMRIAELNVERGRCDTARDVYNYAARTFRGTPTGTEARKRARTVRKACD